MNVNELLKSSYNETISALLRALDLHGPGEADHAERVAVYATATADALGLSDEELLSVRRASLLHDVGKIAIEQSLLCKLGELTEEDMNALRMHSAMAEEVLRGLAWLKPALPMIRHHHERWDGAGYPDGLKGHDIPMGARIIAVAETFDHVAFGSYWKPPAGRFEALEELVLAKGKQFDPEVISAFLEIEPLIQPLETYDTEGD